MLVQVRGAILLHHDEDIVQERTGHLQALDGCANDVADNSEDVEDPREVATLGSRSHKQEDQKQHCGHAKLGCEDDGGADGCQPDLIDVNRAANVG